MLSNHQVSALRYSKWITIGGLGLDLLAVILVLVSSFIVVSECAATGTDPPVPCTTGDAIAGQTKIAFSYSAFYMIWIGSVAAILAFAAYASLRWL